MLPGGNRDRQAPWQSPMKWLPKGMSTKNGTHPAIAKVSLNATYLCCLAGGQAERSQKALM